MTCSFEAEVHGKCLEHQKLQGRHSLNSPACKPVPGAPGCPAGARRTLLDQGQAGVVAELLLQDIGI